MKKTTSILLVTAILAGLLCACSPDTFASSEKLIEKGDASLAAGDLDQALEYYNQAGPEGDAKEKEVLCIKVLLIIKKPSVINSSFRSTYQNNLKEALKYLEDKTKYSFTDEERYVFLLECLKEYVPTLNLTELEYLLQITESTIPVDISELKEGLNDTYFAEGYAVLEEFLANPNDYSYPLRKAIAAWSNCTEGPGLALTEAIDTMIPSGHYADGFAVLGEHIADVDVLTFICSELRKETSFESIDELFNYESAYYSVLPRKEISASLSESFSHLESVRLGNSHDEDSILLTGAELTDVCGLNPDNRVLFLHKPSKYDDSIGLYLPFMDLLPNAYYPYSLESVEYVILMTCESVMTGAKFGDTTEEMREDTTVTLYDVKTGKILFETICEGPTSLMMTYYGDTPPSVYSAGAPYVGSAIQSAINELESHINP